MKRRTDGFLIWLLGVAGALLFYAPFIGIPNSIADLWCLVLVPLFFGSVLAILIAIYDRL